VSTKPKQLKLHLPTWGGKRKYAGRKPKGQRSARTTSAESAAARRMGSTRNLACTRSRLEPSEPAVLLGQALNRVMRRRGPVFADHYHSRVVRTPAEAARVLAYVLRNFARHARQSGDEVSEDEPDAFSSAARSGADPPPTVCEPRTWLLSVGGGGEWNRSPCAQPETVGNLSLRPAGGGRRVDASAFGEPQLAGGLSPPRPG
jgi:hypothetical protein